MTLHLVTAASRSRECLEDHRFNFILFTAGRPLCLLKNLTCGQPASGSLINLRESQKQLDSRFSESQVAIGLATNGQLLEVFSTGDGSTWTIVITKPDGMSCVLTTGEGWDGREKTALGQPA